ncbi:hypothetical protein [Faecalibacterium sp. OF04-11AC]|uniref:hypothetical protein n=1 Tax=Faecalibacterium sp. OF04-11AC TaxID=2293109 RepID=UPI00325BF97C
MPRQSQNQSPAPSRKKALLSVAILLALTGVLILLFKDHWAEISAALAQLSLGQVALVLALGITYPLLEGVASWLIVRSRLPGFTLRHGIDNAWMGTFGNVICLGAGAVPMQTYYLHRCGLGLGPGVGLMTLQYVFHKAAVLVYATVLLLWNRQWFTAHATGVLSYLPPPTRWWPGSSWGWCSSAPPRWCRALPAGLWACCPRRRNGRPAGRAGRPSWTP